MIYLFHGSDVERVRAKAFAWVRAAQEKEPNLTYVRLSREDATPAALDNAVVSRSLFAKRTLILLDDPYGKYGGADDEDAEQDDTGTSFIDDRLDAFADSENVIVILAPKLASAKVKRISTRAAHSYAFDSHIGKESRGFNSPLVDALAERSNEKLWVEVTRALEAGDAPEMIHGLLQWKARDLMVKRSRAWSPAEARALSVQLITVLMDARRTGGDLRESLERFAL